MDTYRLSAIAHIVFAVVLVGQALFWFIMLAALRQRFAAADVDRYFGVLSGARWPHVAVPYRLRIPLAGMQWLVIALTVGTGFLLLSFRDAPENLVWWVKMMLLTASVIVQMRLTLGPSAALIRLNMGLVLAIVVMAGWAIR
jgi:hypothetical protein